MLLIFILIFVYTLVLFVVTVGNAVRIWCSWCSIADFSSACTGSSPVIRYLSIYSNSFWEMFGRIMFWLLIMVLGGAMVYFSANLVEIFWRSGRAESKMWWTRQLWMLIWFVGMVVWWLVMFWIIGFSDPWNLGTV